MPGRNGEEDPDTFYMRKRKERWWGMIDRTTKRLSDKIWGNYALMESGTKKKLEQKSAPITSGNCS